MMQTDSTLTQLLQSVEQNGVCVEREIHGFPMTGVDIVLPHVVLLLCLRGSARVMFDMKELSIERNDYGVLLPGHDLRRITCSDDFANLRVIISAEMISELKTRAFSHDYDKFNYAPKCHLTDVQAKRMMALFELLEAIASHDTDDLQQRRQILLSHMAVGIEFVNYYRREQDREWAESRSAKLYTQFCDLVIQQYVATQAKLIMDTHPEQTVKETAYQLGFPTTANFCRYFKRATGIYPQAYKERMI